MSLKIFRRKPKHIRINISTYEADLEFTVKSGAKGKSVLDLVCQTIGLRETWYFGLAHNDHQWIKLSKQIAKQGFENSENEIKLKFLAKFYPESVEDELIQEVTRHLFFLQTQDAIISEGLYCPPENAILLASYALQAKYGDLDLKASLPDSVSNVEFLPKRVRDQFQMTDTMWEEKINEWYAEHRGLTRDEAELEYLKIAQDLEMFGVDYFKIKNHKGSELWLGINAVSVNVYEPENQLIPIVSFQWSELADMSFHDNKFIIKQSTLPSIRTATLRRNGNMTEKNESVATEITQSKDFIFFTEEPGINKIILELCRGNHDLFMRRRRVDSMEIQQMKTQAKEERMRKQMEKSRMLRDKELREQIECEKEDLERKVKELQEEARAALDALHRSEETAELLAEKAKIAEEEALLLKRKANHAEQEMQRIKTEFAKTQEANIQLQQNLQNYDQVTKQLAEDSKTKAAEADKLRKELKHAKQAQAEAKEKLTNVVNGSKSVNSSADMSYNPYSGVSETAPKTSSPVPRGTNMTDSIVVTGSSVSPLQIQPLPSANVNMNNMSIGSEEDHGNNYSRVTEMQHLSQEIEKERMEYQAKSKHIEQQLAMLKTEIEGLKVDEKMTPLDHMYTENSLKGASKYQSLNQTQESTPQQRLQFYNDL